MASGKGNCDFSETCPPILTLDDTRKDLPAFYTDKDAGGHEVSFGAHEGKLLREIPECYICWYQMIGGSKQQFQRAAKKYLRGLREYREKINSHRQGIRMPVPPPAPQFTSVMQFGRYEGVALRNVPLLYLLWTRGDLSELCRESEIGKKYFAILEDYIQTLETSWPEARGPIWKADIPGMGESISFYARPSDGAKSFSHFTYRDLDNDSYTRRKVVVGRLTRILFPPVAQQVRISTATNRNTASDVTTTIDQLTSQLGSVVISTGSSK